MFSPSLATQSLGWSGTTGNKNVKTDVLMVTCHPIHNCYSLLRLATKHNFPLNPVLLHPTILIWWSTVVSEVEFFIDLWYCSFPDSMWWWRGLCWSKVRNIFMWSISIFGITKGFFRFFRDVCQDLSWYEIMVAKLLYSNPTIKSYELQYHTKVRALC
jgi:hypothetical protein